MPPRPRPARGPAGPGQARPGTRWPPRIPAARRCPRWRRSRRTARTAPGPGRAVSSSRYAAPAALAASTAASSATWSCPARWPAPTPAVCMHRAQRRPVRPRSRPAARPPRPARPTSQAITSAPVPGARPAPRPAPAAPGAAGPDRLASTTRGAPRPASHRATWPPIAPVPPVTSTRPARHPRSPRPRGSGARTSRRARIPAAPDRDLVLPAPGQHAAQPRPGPFVQHRRHVDQAAPPVRVLQARDPAQAPGHRLHRAGQHLAGSGGHRPAGQHPQRGADPRRRPAPGPGPASRPARRGTAGCAGHGASSSASSDTTRSGPGRQGPARPGPRAPPDPAPPRRLGPPAWRTAGRQRPHARLGQLHRPARPGPRPATCRSARPGQARRPAAR